MVRTYELKSGEELVGRLEEESFLELLFAISSTKFPVYFWVRYGGEEGHFYFRNGKMIHASTRTLKGREAAYYVLSWRNGVFRIVSGREPDIESVDISFTEFTEKYIEEIEKLVQKFSSDFGYGFYLEFLDRQERKLFDFNYLFSKDRVFEFKEVLNELPSNVKKELIYRFCPIYTKEIQPYYTLITHIPEMRYFIGMAIDKKELLNKAKEWLRDEFSPKVVDCVSIALRKADRARIRATVLVIEPDLKQRAWFGSVLTANGFRVYLAEDGYEALVKVEDFRPDIILLELNMPRITGKEVYRRLRRKDETRSIPVLCLVDAGIPKGKELETERAGEFYLEKPFSDKKLLSVLETILEIR